MNTSLKEWDPIVNLDLKKRVYVDDSWTETIYMH